MDIQNTLQSLLDKLHSIGNTETVVGEPIEVAGIKLIPINKLSIGFGAAVVNASSAVKTDVKHQLSTDAGGVGGGIRLKPVAFIAVAPDGTAQLLCLDEPEVNLIDKLLLIVPELAEQLLERKSKVKSEPAEPAPKDTASDSVEK